MEKADIKKKILEEEEYIRFPKLMNSLTKFLEKYPDGVKNATIARLLLISEEEVDTIYGEAIELLKKEMKD